MNRISPFVRGMLILAALSVIIVALSLQASVVTASLLVQVAFFLAVAFAAYLLWRDFGRREIALWPTRMQWVFYGAVGLFVVDLGWFFLPGVRGPDGPDALVFFVVAGVCIYAAVRTWRNQRMYS